MSSDDRVFRAANTLLLRGVKPSWEKVREVMGGGSKSTIVPALNRYWKEGGWRVLVEMPTPNRAPEVEFSGDMVPRSELEKAVALAQERADAERAHLMAETDRMRQEVTGPLRKMEGELLLARAKIAALERERR